MAKHVVKFRYSDGGVVDIWEGPDEVDEVTEAGPTYVGGPKYPWYRYLGEFIGLDKGKPRYKRKKTNPINQLASPTQGAIEITQAQFDNMLPLCDNDGRLRWKVVDGSLTFNKDLIYVTHKITDAPAENRGKLGPLTIGDLHLKG